MFRIFGKIIIAFSLFAVATPALYAETGRVSAKLKFSEILSDTNLDLCAGISEKNVHIKISRKTAPFVKNGALFKSDRVLAELSGNGIRNKILKGNYFCDKASYASDCQAPLYSTGKKAGDLTQNLSLGLHNKPWDYKGNDVTLVIQRELFREGDPVDSIRSCSKLFLGKMR